VQGDDERGRLAELAGDVGEVAAGAEGDGFHAITE
jgi:hypothetical protein